MLEKQNEEEHSRLLEFGEWREIEVRKFALQR